MSRSIEIRRLRPADAEDYRIVRLAALETEPDAFSSTYAVEASRPMSTFADRLASSVVFGAYDDGRIVGMIGFKQEAGPKDSHKAFVWGFYVQPECRQQAIGSALICKLIQTARKTVEQLTLTVVGENEAAISLYTRFGFTIYGVEPRAFKSATGYSNGVQMALGLV